MSKHWSILINWCIVRMSYRFLVVKAVGFLGFHSDATRILSETEIVDVPSSTDFVGETELRLENAWPQGGERYTILPRFNVQIDFTYHPVRVEIICRVCATSLTVVFSKWNFHCERKGHFVPVDQNGNLFRVGTLRETGEKYFYFCEKSICRQCIIQAAHHHS
uniref:MP n=1 Tax=Southern bean mosaic virus TaxID=12139 RepID=A0A8E4JF84_9VIRU|nr:MP [Southern bean mosaic virus]